MLADVASMQMSCTCGEHTNVLQMYSACIFLVGTVNIQMPHTCGDHAYDLQMQ